MNFPPVLSAGLSLLLTASSELQSDSYKNAVLNDKPFAYYRLGEAASHDPVGRDS